MGIPAVVLPIGLAVIKLIYKGLRDWLYEEAKKSETPVDNYMLQILDKLLLEE